MNKKQACLMLEMEDHVYLSELMKETGLNKSNAISLVLSFLRENFLTLSVVSHHRNGFKQKDRRYKDGVKHLRD